MTETRTVALNVEAVARICHEVNRAYCQSIGDDSQLPWEDAPDWQRESAIDGVKFVMEHTFAGPDASHENWRRAKEAAGWKHGPVKDPHKKEHPCMVSFDNLPEEQKAKDYIFRAVVLTTISGPSVWV